MPYRRSYRPRRTRRPMYRRRFNRYRTRGTGRGYRPGFNRFGRVSAPELKAKVLARDSTIGAGQIEDIVVFPSIVQGINQDQRIGNRINAKFLNVRAFFTLKRAPDIDLPQEPCLIRYVLWMNKDPTTNAAGTIANLSLTSFLNTKTIRVLKTGYLTLSNYGQARILKINQNMRNKTIDFLEDSDVSANTSQRIFMTVYSTEQVGYEYQSKFYFADP